MKYKLLPYETFEGLCVQCGDPVIDVSIDAIFNIPFCERHVPARRIGYDVVSFGRITANISCPHDPEWIMMDDSFSLASCAVCMWKGNSLLFHRNKSDIVPSYMN